MAELESNATIQGETTSNTPISDSIRDAIKTGKDAIYDIGNRWNQNDTEE